MLEASAVDEDGPAGSNLPLKPRLDILLYFSITARSRNAAR